MGKGKGMRQVGGGEVAMGKMGGEKECGKWVGEEGWKLGEAVL